MEALTGMNHELASFLRSLTTSLGLVPTTLILPISAGEAGSGLVLPAVATLILITLYGFGHKKLV